MIFFLRFVNAPSESDESVLGDVEERSEVLVVTAEAEGPTAMREVESDEISVGKTVRFGRCNITRKCSIA